MLRTVMPVTRASSSIVRSAVVVSRATGAHTTRNDVTQHHVTFPRVMATEITSVDDVDLTPQSAETSFSMELNQDQKDIRDWVHGFAEGVVRPAAAEWDEREEFPWPIVEEAAKIGLYG